MKISQILIQLMLCLILCDVSGCKKCKDIEFIQLHPTMERYFSTYKTGTYWIYFNQDSSKLDSVYITNFVSTTGGSVNVKCIEWEERTFELNSNFLTPSLKLTVEYRHNDDRILTLLNATSLGRSWGIEAKTDADTLLPIAQGPSVWREQLFQLWDNPQLTIPEVTRYRVPNYDDFIFAPDFGIIQFNSADNIDTFRLVRYHIQ